jgi:hypothetical protein
LQKGEEIVIEEYNDTLTINIYDLVNYTAGVLKCSWLPVTPPTSEVKDVDV